MMMRLVVGTLAWAFVVLIAAELLQVELTWRVALLFLIANITTSVIDAITVSSK